MTLTAKIAHCTNRRHGSTSYQARVRLYNDWGGTAVHCGAFTGLGDTLAEAKADAIRYMQEQLRREDLAIPAVQDLGKLPKVKFESPNFA